MESKQPENLKERRSRRLAILFFILVPVLIIAGIMAVRYLSSDRGNHGSAGAEMSAKHGMGTGPVEDENGGAGNNGNENGGTGNEQNGNEQNENGQNGTGDGFNGAGAAGSGDISGSETGNGGTGVGSNVKIDLESENAGFLGENAEWTELPENAGFDPEAPPEITALFEGYFNAKLSGDAELAGSCFTGGGSKDPEEERQKLLTSLKYIEDYRDVTCYTLKGPVEDSLVVYVYFKIKFYQSEIPAPSLSSAFVIKDDGGAWRIYEGTMSERLKEYMEQAGRLEPAKALARQVQEEFGQALADDEHLAEIYSIAMAGPESTGTDGGSDSVNTGSSAEDSGNDHVPAG